jgi:hypothetical protein
MVYQVVFIPGELFMQHFYFGMAVCSATAPALLYLLHPCSRSAKPPYAYAIISVDFSIDAGMFNAKLPA